MLRHRIESSIFEKIHLGNLVYNTCWEDPRCDRQMLRLDPSSRVVVLTSAGCNALDYLLDSPAAVHCVDMNPRQNALLHLKIGFFQRASHPEFFEFFGTGSHPEAHDFYQDSLKNAIAEPVSQKFWDKSIGHFFAGRGLRDSFYWHGTSGAVAWALRQWLRSQPKAERLLRRLFESESLAEQAIWYEKVEPQLMGKFFGWFVRQHVVQSMLGVPKSQQTLAQEKYADGLAGYIRACLRRVFTEIPVQDNYFWQLYFFGRYLPSACPNYLRPENFARLKAQIGKIRTHTATVSRFLSENPGQYSHFVLLDHLDWLAAHDRPALDEEWRLIFENAAPEAKVLFRSAAPDAAFLPDWVRERLVFDADAAEKSQKTDRVGTYASTHFALISQSS